MPDFSKMTVAELKNYAKENDIDLGDAKRKTEILAKVSGMKASFVKQEEPGENVIVSKTTISVSGKKSSGTYTNDDGVVVSKKTEKKDKVVEGEEVEKTAIFSTKNMNWMGVGSLSKGYNIVTKEVAKKWLTRNGVREATPEEVATFYGV